MRSPTRAVSSCVEALREVGGSTEAVRPSRNCFFQRTIARAELGLSATLNNVADVSDAAPFVLNVLCSYNEGKSPVVVLPTCITRATRSRTQRQRLATSIHAQPTEPNPSLKNSSVSQAVCALLQHKKFRRRQW